MTELILDRFVEGGWLPAFKGEFGPDDHIASTHRRLVTVPLHPTLLIRSESQCQGGLIPAIPICLKSANLTADLFWIRSAVLRLIRRLFALEVSG